jgi:primosomal protein DnaI
MRRHAQVRERYLSATLADFGNIAEIMNNALSNCLSKNIIACVYGSPGTGKTHLLSAVVNDATLLGYKAKFVEAQQLFEHFERSRYRDYSADEFYDYASSATVLAIDEVDKFVPSDYAYMRFFTLFNNRYASHSGLTVIATNRDPHSGIWSDGVGPFESRILARHNIIINLGTKDRRH